MTAATTARRAESARRCERLLTDLATFVRVFVASGDLEPWAALLRQLYTSGAVDLEQALWLVALYNTYDDFGQAFAVYARWRGPHEWAAASDRGDVVDYMPAQERRNLRGGRVLRRFESYLELLDGGPQAAWCARAVGGDPGPDFTATTVHLRRVWGVGRQAAFEWAEFLAKVAGLPLTAPDAQLWESEGPRHALERIYGNRRPTRAWLEARAGDCREFIAQASGIRLPWEDFETAICDFKVMVDGRYYLGKHLAMIREEIDSIPDPPLRSAALSAFREVIPAPWRDIRPGARKDLQVLYRDTGRMVTRP